MATTEHRPLVDHAEQALRQWLAPGRHRAGDRLPPEHDLAAMLGVSRGPLRAALSRLEETGDAHSLVFEAHAGLTYKAGQFLTLAVPSERTGVVARCYSLSSAPHETGHLQVTVKRTVDGYASNWICDNVVPGTTMTVLPPSGIFTPRDAPAHPTTAASATHPSAAAGSHASGRDDINARATASVSLGRKRPANSRMNAKCSLAHSAHARSSWRARSSWS